MAQAATAGGTGSTGRPPGIAGALPLSTAAARRDRQAARREQRSSSRPRSTPAGPPGRPTATAATPAGRARSPRRSAPTSTKVQAILDANRPARPSGASRARPAGTPGTRPAGPRAGRPPRPDNTKLIAALASGLDIDTAKVEAAFATLDAAHKADHADHADRRGRDVRGGRQGARSEHRRGQGRVRGQPPGDAGAPVALDAPGSSRFRPSYGRFRDDPRVRARAPQRYRSDQRGCARYRRTLSQSFPRCRADRRRRRPRQARRRPGRSRRARR